MIAPLLIGLDLGTSAVKVVLVEQTGTVLAETSVALDCHVPRPGWSEQSPADWVNATWRGLRDIVQLVPDAPRRLSAMAVAGQMHGAVLLGESGAPLRPAILWNDQRSASQCEEISNRTGFDRLVSLVGNRALAGFTAPKLLWVRENEPELYGQVRSVLLPKDYLNYRLTGVMATEPSDASGTLLFDVTNRQWSSDLVRALEISPQILPPVVASSDPVGSLTPEAAAASGLPVGLPVIAGGADNACAALGVGVMKEGDVMVSVGTSGTVVAPSDRPRIDPLARLHTFCHAVPDTWYSMGVTLSAGASLRWFRDTIWLGSPGNAANDYDAILAAAATVPIGCEGLTFLPYLSGERTPHPDPYARGVFFGLTHRHSRAHLARSVVEGITFALRDSLSLMDEIGIRTGAVRLSGGGAKSRVWTQIMADVFQKPVSVASADMGPAFGAAMLAGVGSKVFAAFPEATLQRAADPDAAAGPAYDEAYSAYRDLYPALESSFARLT